MHRRRPAALEFDRVSALAQSDRALDTRHVPARFHIWKRASVRPGRRGAIDTCLDTPSPYLSSGEDDSMLPSDVFVVDDVLFEAGVQDPHPTIR